LTLCELLLEILVHNEERLYGELAVIKRVEKPKPYVNHYGKSKEQRQEQQQAEAKEAQLKDKDNVESSLIVFSKDTLLIDILDKETNQIRETSNKTSGVKVNKSGTKLKLFSDLQLRFSDTEE